MILITSTIWAVAMYFIAKNIAKDNPELNIRPINYTILAFLFSILFSGSILGYKISNAKGNLVGKLISILVMVFVVVFNIILLFG